MDENTAATMFQALSNADRLKVIKALVIAGPGGMNAGEIAENVGASPSRASFHLSALAEAGFVQSERQSRSIRYFVDFEAIGSLLSFLMNDCCGGNAQLKSCCR